MLDSPTRQSGENVRANCNVVSNDSFSASSDKNNSGDSTIRGRIRGGRRVSEHLCDQLELNEADVRKIAVNADLTIAERMAAKWALRCLTDDTTRGGIPLASYDIDRLMDRTVGRPSQQVNITEEHKTVNVINLTREALDDAKEALTIDI
jgi:hypothetical protein